MAAFDFRKLTATLAKNRYVLLVLALGLLLLLLPRSGRENVEDAVSERAAGTADPLEASGIPLDTESDRLAALLSSIRGVGEARVLLSRTGAVVVCAGGEDAAVRLEVTNAVSAYTGLGCDQIRVMKLK